MRTSSDWAFLTAFSARSLSSACGLSTLDLFDGVAHPFAVRDGAIAVPRGPGLLG